MLTPEESEQQRREALERGNRIRRARAVLKRDVKAGRVAASSVLMDPPEYVLTMKAIDLAMCAPQWGRVRATRAMNVVRVSHAKTIGGLTERQRLELARALSAEGASVAA